LIEELRKSIKNNNSAERDFQPHHFHQRQDFKSNSFPTDFFDHDWNTATKGSRPKRCRFVGTNAREIRMDEKMTRNSNGGKKWREFRLNEKIGNTR
jgi:hypothetical protein